MALFALLRTVGAPSRSHEPPAHSPPEAAPPAVQLLGACKRFQAGGPAALDHVTLAAAPGEFLCLLGPSGSGKTTALRAIGGYERLDAGAILLDGVVADGVPAHRRNVGMVFQNYALFPHLTVAQNVAFGLRMRGAPRLAQAEQVRWALDLVRLPGLEQRYPGQLSGGQQQRVALARAIAFGPSLLLLDEPFANLDRHLRDEMRLELKALQRQLGVTTIFVTHDQEEALALADRIAVLNAGRVEQVGTPETLYNRPLTGFVARFIGETNVVSTTLGGPAPLPAGERSESGAARRLALVAGHEMVVCAPEGAGRGDVVSACLRAERLRLVPLDSREVPAGKGRAPAVAGRLDGLVHPAGADEEPGEYAGWDGTVRLVTYRGVATLYVVDLDAGPAVRVLEPSAGPAPAHHAGDRVRVVWCGGAPRCVREVG